MLSKENCEAEPGDPDSCSADNPFIAETRDKDQAYDNKHDNDTRGQIRLLHDEKQWNCSKRSDDNQCAEIVDPLLISLQKPGEENNQTDLNKFRRLETSDNRKHQSAEKADQLAVDIASVSIYRAVDHEKSDRI